MKDYPLICGKCKRELIPKKIQFTYLGHRVSQEFPSCPVCGNFYIPEDVVNTKMHKLETELEDK